MKKFRVSIREKKTDEIIKACVIEAEKDLGIILKAKIQLIGEGFKYDKRKHSASWCEI